MMPSVGSDNTAGSSQPLAPDQFPLPLEVLDSFSTKLTTSANKCCPSALFAFIRFLDVTGKGEGLRGEGDKGQGHRWQPHSFLENQLVWFTFWFGGGGENLLESNSLWN